MAITILRRQRQEEFGFGAILGYIAKGGSFPDTFFSLLARSHRTNLVG